MSHTLEQVRAFIQLQVNYKLLFSEGAKDYQSANVPYELGAGRRQPFGHGIMRQDSTFDLRL